MSAYLIIEAHLTDPQRFAAYARATPAVVAPIARAGWSGTPAR